MTAGIIWLVRPVLFYRPGNYFHSSFTKMPRFLLLSFYNLIYSYLLPGGLKLFYGTLAVWATPESKVSSSFKITVVKNVARRCRWLGVQIVVMEEGKIFRGNSERECHKKEKNSSPQARHNAQDFFVFNSWKSKKAISLPQSIKSQESVLQDPQCLWDCPGVYFVW